MSQRSLVIVIFAGAMLLGTAGPAAPPDYPVKFIKVDELKAELDRGVKVHIFDVRGPDEYADLHIKGARSMPLRTLEARALKEVPKNGRVVFY
jgi:hypothetical protein